MYIHNVPTDSGAHPSVQSSVTKEQELRQRRIIYPFAKTVRANTIKRRKEEHSVWGNNSNDKYVLSERTL